MDSRTWRQIGRGALAGAVAGAALAAAGFRVSLRGGLEPLPVRPAAALPPDAPWAPDGRGEDNRTMVTQALAGAVVGGVFGFLRTRAEGPENPAETDLYHTVLSTLGLGAWLVPLGLLGGEADRVADDQPGNWSYHEESLLDDAHPPYEEQPPYDPERPYDVF